MTSRSLTAALAIAALSTPATAQTLSRYASPDTVMSFELNDLAGAGKTASAFVRQFASHNLLAGTLGSEGVDANALKVISAAFEREMLVAVNVDGRGNPHFLLAARIPTAMQASAKNEIEHNVRQSLLSGARVQNYRAGGLPFSTVTPKGGEAISYGYTGGLAYASDSADVLGAFLRRTANKQTGGLAASRAYATAMNLAGPGHLRLFLDLKAAGGFLGKFLKDPDLQVENLNLAPLAAAVSSLGRIGLSMRLTAAGIETASVITPDATAGDPAIARLLTPPRLTLRAASVLPATATGFSTGAWDASATINYIPDLLERMGVKDVKATITKELGFDLQRDFASWMGNEIASATLPGQGLGESVYLISVRDGAAASNGIARVMPAIKSAIEALSDVAGQEMGGNVTGVKPTSLTPSTFDVAGTPISSYPLAEGVVLYSAIKNGFLYLTGSQAAMQAALADGPRLDASANYRAMRSRVPASASGYGFSDVGATLKAISPVMREVLTGVSALAGDLPAGETDQFTSAIVNFLDFAASRAGVQASWTDVLPGAIRSNSFLPVKW